VHIDVPDILARGLVDDPLTVRTECGHAHHVGLRGNLPGAASRDRTEDFKIETLVDVPEPSGSQREVVSRESAGGCTIGVHQ
jgi:hypothetical protein